MENNNKEIINQEKEINTSNNSVGVDFNNNFDMQPLLQTAGTLILTDEQKKILTAPVDESKIQIRPDGLIYLPWIEYQTRLDNAFGLAWSLVPQGMPKYDKSTNMILWGFYLIIQGKFVDFAIGQNEYFPTNKQMTYGDAIEGSKSNALMRCCKRLGIGLKLWDRDYVDFWKNKYAEQYYDTDKKKYLWRKKMMNKTSENVENKTEKKQEQKVTGKKEDISSCSIIKDVSTIPGVDCEIEMKQKKDGTDYLVLKLKSPKMTLYCFDTKIIEKIQNISGKFDIHYLVNETSGRSYNNIIDVVQK